MNTIPRVALIPIFVVIARPSLTALVLSVIAVVGFLAFFNALEGGRSIKRSVLDNVELLGASPVNIMMSVRLPVAIEWTFAVLPNAISFGLVIAVTAELLAGLRGIGQLLLISMTNLRADLTFAVILILSLLGVVLYAAGKLLYRLVVRWKAV
jgi:NitT/TauT family transport system permease protein